MKTSIPAKTNIIRKGVVPNSLIRGVGFVERLPASFQIRRKPDGPTGARIVAVQHCPKQRRLVKALVRRPTGQATWINVETLERDWMRV